MLWLLLLLLLSSIQGFWKNLHASLSYQKKKSKVALVWIWHIQGFPKKCPFLKIENISNLITDYKKGKIIENIKASFMGNAVSDE